jgi:iron complex transport system substrate-binding protein
MKKAIIFITCMIVMLFIASCGNVQDAGAWKKDYNISEELTYDYSEKLDYAQKFIVDYYGDGYTLISILDGSRFLIVPEGRKAPDDLKKNIVVLQQPVNNIYMVASAVMDMFVSMDALETIRLSGTKQDSWYIEAAASAMQAGEIIYAGKYNAPDYELILSENCGFAIQSTMILHSPDVKEKLESFGISILVDYSSYEKHPLGRCEWVKMYGALTGRMEEAKLAFSEQKAELEETLLQESEKKTVAFFNINFNGAVNVRKSIDYIPKMIELAGGTYIFENLGDDESASTSVNMQIEEFYAGAKEADYLIYNATIVDEIHSLEELCDKSSLLKEFKAVQNGNVWCTAQDMYQRSMQLGTMISDIHIMLTEDAQNEELSFMYKLE